MKLKLAIVLGMVLAFALGFLLGRVQSSREQQRQLTELAAAERQASIMANFLKEVGGSEAHRALGSAAISANALVSLREGETSEAIDTLENELDGEIVAMGAILQQLPAKDRDPKCIKRIAWWREYRAAHPHKSLYSDDELGLALSLVRTNQ